MPIALSSIYILNLRGESLISRCFKNDTWDVSNLTDAFRQHILEAKEGGAAPVRSISGGAHFAYLRHNDIYVVLVSRTNANMAMGLKLAAELMALFKSYFGVEVTEDQIMKHVSLVYELLDEVIDYGFPQNLSPEVLKLYIEQETDMLDRFGQKLQDRILGKKVDTAAKASATLQVTGAVSWRQEGIFYKKNQVFLDIVENVNLLLSTKGTVLRADVQGKILMRTLLSGMPDLKLGLNDKLGMEKAPGGAGGSSGGQRKVRTIELDDHTFHHCVNMGKFASERTVSFTPPDGEFELMKYRITEGVNLPFRVLPIIKELGRSRVEANVKVKALFTDKLFALNIVIRIPVPKNTAKAQVEVSVGRAKYKSKYNAIEWKIPRFPGGEEAAISAQVELIASTNINGERAWSRPPISMDFQVPMFTASGLRVRFLKVWERSGYETVKWVRYLSKSGSYETRC